MGKDEVIKKESFETFWWMVFFWLVLWLLMWIYGLHVLDNILKVYILFISCFLLIFSFLWLSPTWITYAKKVIIIGRIFPRYKRMIPIETIERITETRYHWLRDSPVGKYGRGRFKGVRIYGRTPSNEGLLVELKDGEKLFLVSKNLSKLVEVLKEYYPIEIKSDTTLKT